MCEKHDYRPIIEVDDDGELVVYAIVCHNCFYETVVIPMTLDEYNQLG